MSVAHDHAAVKAKVTGRPCGDHLDLGRYKVLFLDTISRLKDLQDTGLNLFLGLLAVLLTLGGLFKRDASDEHIKRLAFNHLVALLFKLGSCKMDQKIRYSENRIILLFSYGNIDHTTVFFCDYSVKSQRQCHPLILFDTTIVVGLQKSHLRILIEGILF